MSDVNDLKTVIESIINNPAQLNKIKSNIYGNYKIITIEQQVLAYVDIYSKAQRKVAE